MGKFYLFRTVIEGGYLGLALIGVFTSLISAYYYLRVIVIMYMREGEPEARTEFWVQFTAALTAVLDHCTYPVCAAPAEPGFQGDNVNFLRYRVVTSIIAPYPVHLEPGFSSSTNYWYGI